MRKRPDNTERRKLQFKVLALALCACTFVAFSGARAFRLQPSLPGHVVAKSAAVSTYGWLCDAPDFAVVTFTSTPRPATRSFPLSQPLPSPIALSQLEFAQRVRPPPAV